MIWLYRILFIPALILMMPYYAVRMLRRGGYAKDFSHRFGGQKNLPEPAKNKKRIWIQAVSVGEMEAIGPLVDMFSKNENVEIVITTTTSTAYKILLEKYASKCLYVGIFPIDFWCFNRRAWGKIKANFIIMMEGELWPEHLHQAGKHNAKAVLINARMSDKSFSRYGRMLFVARRIFDKFSRICASTEFDYNRLISLGASSPKTFCTGNIKFDSGPSEYLDADRKEALRSEMGFAKDSFVILGSSTWEGEEEMLVSAMKKLRSAEIDARLLLVPRHAERRAQVKRAIENSPYHIRSESKQAPQGTLIYLADTTGELRTLAQIADLAFVGKSLPPHMGGQTPIDCAALKVPMIYGPNMSNFRRVCETLERDGASVKVPTADAAISEICRLAKNPHLLETIAAKAKSWHTSNIGATKRTYDIIMEVAGK